MGLRRLRPDAAIFRSWLSSRGILQSSGGSTDHVEIVDESLLASLLLVLQQLPSLLTSPPRSDAVPKVREGLSQVRRLLSQCTLSSCLRPCLQIQSKSPCLHPGRQCGCTMRCCTSICRPCCAACERL